MRLYRSRRVDGSATETRKAELLGARTLAQRKEVLKPFFRWLRGTDDKDPPETKGLKVKRSEDHIPTDALITRDDLTTLLQAHTSAQDKARIAVLYESGFRAGEFTALNVGSVQFEELEGGVWSAVPTLPKGVQGLKTGARRIRVFDSVDYLKARLNEHPFREDRNAPLWFTMSHRAPFARLTAKGARCNSYELYLNGDAP
jgi:integrase